MWRPLSCGGPWATAQFAPSPTSGPDNVCTESTCDMLSLKRKKEHRA